MRNDPARRRSSGINGASRGISRRTSAARLMAAAARSATAIHGCSTSTSAPTTSDAKCPGIQRHARNDQAGGPCQRVIGQRRAARSTSPPEGKFNANSQGQLAPERMAAPSAGPAAVDKRNGQRVPTDGGAKPVGGNHEAQQRNAQRQDSSTAQALQEAGRNQPRQRRRQCGQRGAAVNTATPMANTRRSPGFRPARRRAAGPSQGCGLIGGDDPDRHGRRHLQRTRDDRQRHVRDGCAEHSKHHGRQYGRRRRCAADHAQSWHRRQDAPRPLHPVASLP